MASVLRDTSKRLLSRNPEWVDEAQSNPPYSPKRIKLSINTVAREVKSPTTEPHSTRSLDSDESLLSPSPESSSTESRRSGSPSLLPHSLDLLLQKPKESRLLKSPTPDHQLLQSPTPSPSKITNMSSNRDAHQEIDQEFSSETSNESSSSRTLSASSESTLQIIREHPTWPVNTRQDTEYTGATLPEGLIEIGMRTPSFCCANLKIHPRTNPIMRKELEKIHRPVINDFIASIDPKLEDLVTLPKEVFTSVDQIVKVNRVVVGTEISTHLFAFNKKESTFTKFTATSNAMLFNPQGKGSYQSYYCAKHQTMYRVGVYDKKFAGYKDRMSFGDIWIDIKMGLVSQTEVESEHFAVMIRNADHI